MEAPEARPREVDAANAYFDRGWNGEIFRSFNDLSRVPLRVLRMVYMLLSFAFTSSSFGLYFRTKKIIGGSSAAIGSFASIGALYFVAPWLTDLRVFLLITGAFFGGAYFGPWVTWLLNIDQGSVVSALVGISLGFRCYWAASVWARHFDLFYYSGLYICGPVILLWMITASSEFGGHSNQWGSEIYTAVVVFMVYVQAYSQVVVLKTERGDTDYVKHAITLFTEFPTVCLYFGKMTLMEILKRLAEAPGNFRHFFLRK